MTRVQTILWNPDTQIVVRLTGNAELSDVLTVERRNLTTEKVATSEVKVTGTDLLTGLVKASERHLLIGVHCTVVCIDVDKMKEVCRVRESNELGPLEADAVPEEQMAPGGFVFDPGTRRLYMLNGYFDEAALSCYELNKNATSFRRISRRELCGECPRGMSDVLTARGICILPGTDQIVGIFPLEGALVPQISHEVSPPLFRLCWIGVFSSNEDVWIEVKRPFDKDFLGDLKPIGIEEKRGFQFASAEDWFPQPVAIDLTSVAFGTATGKVLLCHLDKGTTSLLHDCRCAITQIAFDQIGEQLIVESKNGRVILSKPFHSHEGTSIDGFRFVRKPRKPKRYDPKALVAPKIQLVSWSIEAPVAINPSGRSAIIGRYIIDVVNRVTVSVLPSHLNPINQVAITRTGERVLTGDGTVRVFKASTGETEREFGTACQFCLSPCERFIALIDFERLSVCDLATGQEIFRVSIGGSNVSWSPDGKSIAFGGWSGNIIANPNGPGLMAEDCCFLGIVDSASGTVVDERRIHDFNNFLWTKHGLLVQFEETIQFFDPQSGLFGNAIEADSFRFGAISPDHSYVALERNVGVSDVANSLEVKVLQLPKLELKSAFRREIAPPNSFMSLSNDFLLLNSDHLQLYKPKSGEHHSDVGPAFGHSINQRLASASPKLLTHSGQLFEAKAQDASSEPSYLVQNSVRVWDLTKHQWCMAEFTIQGPDFLPNDGLAFSSDGRWVAIREEQSVNILDVDRQSTRRVELAERIYGPIEFNRTGERLAIPVMDFIHIWTTTASKRNASLRCGGKPPKAIRFSDDSRWLVAGVGNKTILWDLEDPNSAGRSFYGHAKDVLAVCISPDSRRVMSCSDDRVIRVWNLQTGQLEHVLDGPTNLSCSDLLPIGREYVAGKHSNSIWIWNLTTGVPDRCLVTSCQAFGLIAPDKLLTASGCEYQIWSLG